MLPGFHLQTLRRKPQSAQQKRAKEMALLKRKSFKQIDEFLENFIPRSLLKPEQTGTMSRRRLFSKEVIRGTNEKELDCVSQISGHNKFFIYL